MSSGSGNSNNSNGNRSGYSFPDFSLRRLLLQTRATRNPYTARMCDVERGATGNGKSDKNACASSSMSANKVSVIRLFLVLVFVRLDFAYRGTLCMAASFGLYILFWFRFVPNDGFSSCTIECSTQSYFIL